MLFGFWIRHKLFSIQLHNYTFFKYFFPLTFLLWKSRVIISILFLEIFWWRLSCSFVIFFLPHAGSHQACFFFSFFLLINYWRCQLLGVAFFILKVVLDWPESGWPKSTFLFYKNPMWCPVCITNGPFCPTIRTEMGIYICFCFLEQPILFSF